MAIFRLLPAATAKKNTATLFVSDRKIHRQAIANGRRCGDVVDSL
ncbi:MAG: hypothetical protein WCL57_19125 [Chloroflexota bacterium]